MTTNDLLFIIIFIVVPTAAIVSGFWYILVVRRTPRARTVEKRVPVRTADETEIAAQPEPETAQPPESTDEAPEPEPVVILADLSTVLTAGPPANQDVAEISPMAADLLEYDAVEDRADHPDIPDEAERRALWEEIEQSPGGRAATEEIPDVEDDVGAQHEDLPQDESSPDEIPAHQRQPTEQWEIDDDELLAEDEPEQPAQHDELDDDPDESGMSDDQDEDEGDGESRQRARLIPTEPVQRPKTRRGRHSGRRVPRIPRLRRNEGRVERGDGSDDILL